LVTDLETLNYVRTLSNSFLSGGSIRGQKKSSRKNKIWNQCRGAESSADIIVALAKNDQIPRKIAPIGLDYPALLIRRGGAKVAFGYARPFCNVQFERG
jgi:hypothetical protein